MSFSSSIISLLSSDFSPFSGLFEVRELRKGQHRKYPDEHYTVHSQFLRSTFWGKILATFEVFFGDIFGNTYPSNPAHYKKAHPGILDYVPFLFLTYLVVFKLASFADSIQKSKLYNLVWPSTLIIGGILFGAKFIIASILTLVFSPVVLIAHGISLLAGGHKFKEQIETIPGTLVLMTDPKKPKIEKTLSSYNTLKKEFKLDELNLEGASIVKGNIELSASNSTTKFLFRFPINELTPKQRESVCELNIASIANTTRDQEEEEDEITASISTSSPDNEY